MSGSKTAPVDRAVAMIKTRTSTDALKVSVTGTLADAMAKSPNWAAATDVQTAVKGWTASADALDSNGQAIDALRAQLGVAVSKQRGLRRDWVAAKKHVT